MLGYVGGTLNAKLRRPKIVGDGDSLRAYVKVWEPLVLGLDD